jgi:hypothetical protein
MLIDMNVHKMMMLGLETEGQFIAYKNVLCTSALHNLGWISRVLVYQRPD